MGETPLFNKTLLMASNSSTESFKELKEAIQTEIASKNELSIKSFLSCKIKQI
jgi:hypothetical protein